MTIAELTAVWTPLAMLIALGEGLLFGYVLIGRFAVDPAYATRVARPLEYGALTALMTAAAGLVFYAGQILASYLGGDTAWTRVVSRYGIWVAFSVAIGFGMWVRLHRHLARKHAEVHDRATSDHEAES